MERIEIEVPEIHCDHCKSAIEGALASVPGVLEASVDVEARRVVARVDDGHARRAAVVAAIEAQGYDVPEADAARHAPGRPESAGARPAGDGRRLGR